MDGVLFETAFGRGFSKKKILVDEMLPQNADFFILDNMKISGCSILLLNDDVTHFKEIQKKRSISTQIHSIYDGYCCENTDIVDDYQIHRNFDGLCENKALIHIYRAGTATTNEYYGYDLVVKIQPLESGCSSKIDGEIRVFNRDIQLYHYKYKVLPDKTLYYPIDSLEY